MITFFLNSTSLKPVIMVLSTSVYLYWGVGYEDMHRLGKDEKLCKGCNRIKKKSKFIATCGQPNPRAKYCGECFNRRKEEARIEILDREAKYLEWCKKEYGEEYLAYVIPSNMNYILFFERDFCPYCGNQLRPKGDRAIFSEDIKTHSNLEHMDPLCSGGEDTLRNTIYICAFCNQRKGEKPFLEWLKTLKPEYQDFARKIYIEKHGHKPEDFVAGPPTDRVSNTGVWYMYPDEF